MTVPKPFMVKTRSTGRRKRLEGGRSGICRASASRAWVNSGSPWPVTAETGMMGAFSRKVPRVNSLTSSVASSSISSSTRSTLVKTTSPWRTPSSVQISMCSRVWGMTPSSAAITMATMSIPVAPATMFFTNFSWPGTSTTPKCWPLGRSRWAKPSSMVIPRSFSSFRRSVSIPVTARTRDVLPWSMWPAVPKMICFNFGSS